MPQLPIPVGIQLVDPISEIYKKVLFAFRDELNVIIPKAVPKIKTEIQKKSKVFFENTPEAAALINGPLNADFGIPKGEERTRVYAIIQTVIDNIDVTYRRVAVLGNGLIGGITVGAVVSDFSDVLSRPEGKVTTAKGQELPWLEWLLIRGDSLIISDYSIRFGNYSNSRFNSRSEEAIMIEQQGGFWRVPLYYSGTVDDNWLTRAVLDLSDAYIGMITATIQQQIEAAI